MKIYKVLVDKKPNNCIECPLISLRLCGKDRTVKPDSSSAYQERVPDKQCLLRVKEKKEPLTKRKVVEMVSREEYNLLLKRFRHLLKSETIASYDEVDPRTGEYKRDIEKLDNTYVMRSTKNCSCKQVNK